MLVCGVFTLHVGVVLVTKMPSFVILISPSPTPRSIVVVTLSRDAIPNPTLIHTRTLTGMVSGGRCLAFALRLPHGASVLARSQGVVMGIERLSPFGGRRMLSTEASTQSAAPAPSKGTGG